MPGRRRALVAVVLAVLAVAGTSACEAPTVPIGAQAAGDNVEAFVGSCSGVAIELELLATDAPPPTTTTRPPRSTPGTAPAGGSTTRGTVWDPGEVVWEGTVPVDQQSMVIPVALDPDLTYTITAHGKGDPHFEDYTFLPGDLAVDGVAPLGTWNEPVTPEEFAEQFDTACDEAAGPFPWIIGGVLLMGLLVVVAFVVGLALLIRSATKPRPRPPMVPPPTWG